MLFPFQQDVCLSMILANSVNSSISDKNCGCEHFGIGSGIGVVVTKSTGPIRIERPSSTRCSVRILNFCKCKNDRLKPESRCICLIEKDFKSSADSLKNCCYPMLLWPWELGYISGICYICDGVLPNGLNFMELRLSNLYNLIKTNIKKKGLLWWWTLNTHCWRWVCAQGR